MDQVDGMEVSAGLGPTDGASPQSEGHEAATDLHQDNGPAPKPTWWDAVDKADPKELAKHTRIAGIIGSISDRQTQTRLKELEAKHAAALSEFSAQQSEMVAGLKPHLDRHVEEKVKCARAESLSYHTNLISQQLIDLTADMDPTEKMQFVQAFAVELSGKDDAAALSTAVRHIAKTIAARDVRRFRETELVELRKAIRNEEAAKLMSRIPAPNIAGAKNHPDRPNIGEMSTREFDQLSPPNESMEDAVRRVRGR